MIKPKPHCLPDAVSFSLKVIASWASVKQCHTKQSSFTFHDDLLRDLHNSSGIQSRRQKILQILTCRGHAQANRVNRRPSRRKAQSDARRQTIAAADRVYRTRNNRRNEPMNSTARTGPDGGLALTDNDPLRAAVVQFTHRRVQRREMCRPSSSKIARGSGDHQANSISPTGQGKMP
jgi:hypothetical protein